MFYDNRNMQNIAKLADNTKKAALAWYKYCQENKINILIYETIRSKEKQAEYVKAGSSQTMTSYHLVGQALDFVLVDEKGQTLWGAYHTPKAKQAVAYAKKLGFTWGGDWTGFVDCPHLQFNHKGYGTDTFGKVSQPSKPTLMQKRYTSIVDYLKAHGQNASYAARQLLASKYGIKDYTGTASQNTKLLNILQGS